MSDEGTWELPGTTHWHGCGNLGGPEHLGCPRTVYPAMLALQADHRATQVEAILTDLIDELRHQAPRKYRLANGTVAMGWKFVQERADNAEARLREVTGDG